MFYSVGQLFKDNENIHGIITAMTEMFNFYSMYNYQVLAKID